MRSFRTISVFAFFLTLNLAQGQNPYAQPVEGAQQGGLNNAPMQAVPVEGAPLIDLTTENAMVPTEATMGNRHIPAEDIGTNSHMSERISRSSVVQEYKPEKFKVYPDDPDSAIWETNVRYSFYRAQREMKPMLLLFTSISNKAAMSLSQEVFATKSFNNYVKENLVICYLNYPMNIKDAPESMRWAKKEFRVAGYPSVLIFNPNGDVDRSLRGYRSGRPVDYFNNLKEACAPTLASIKARKDSLAKQGFREWHNSERKGLFARFVKRDDYLMTLIDAKGKEWTVAIGQLCQEDRQMARAYPRLDQVMKDAARR